MSIFIKVPRAANWKGVCLQNILNRKRNFRKIGLRGGHTRYERKKKSTPTSNETEISNEINDFQTVHEL